MRAVARGITCDGRVVRDLMQDVTASRLARAVLVQRKRDAVIDRCEFVELCALDNRGQPVHQSWIHRSWHGHVEWCWGHGLHPVIIAPWGHGKCEAEGTLVQAADGRLVPIEQWQGGILVAFDEQALAFEAVETRPVFENGVHSVVEVRLRSGRVKRCTENHPLFTVLGWQQAGQLAVGQRVAVLGENERPARVVEAPVAWDEVIAIERLDDRMTYGIAVPGLHSYVSDGIVSHNSLQIAVEMPVWALGRWPWLRIAVVCNIDSNARLRSAAACRAIRNRPATKLAFSHLSVPGVHSQFSFSITSSGGSKVDPSFRAWGIFGSGTSTRIDLLILDDIVDQNNALKSPALRQAVCDQVDMVWFPRLTPPCQACGGSGVEGGPAAWDAGSREACPQCAGAGGGRSLSIGTMWHRQDYWHRCLKTPGYCTLLQRVSADKAGYSSEAYGVPPGVRYPTLEELVVLGSPAASRDELLARLLAAQDKRQQEELVCG